MLTANNQEWKAETRDFRSLSELIDIWWKFEGRNMRWGHKRKTALLRIAREMNNPAIYQITPKFLAVYRSDRLWGSLPNYLKLVNVQLKTLLKAYVR
jgi:hypothetical protein